jgi:hypothetical protein
MARASEVHTTSATAVTDCVVLKIVSGELNRLLHEGDAFSDLFAQFIAH